MNLTPLHEDIYAGKICPYCNSGVKVVSEKEIYGTEFKGRKIIACKNFPTCDSYVGTHDDGVALGRLANKELRQAKTRAHYWFDKIWKEKYKKRSHLYTELSEYLNIDGKYTHIGMFNPNTCLKVAEWAENEYKNYLKK